MGLSPQGPVAQLWAVRRHLFDRWQVLLVHSLWLWLWQNSTFGAQVVIVVGAK